MSQRRITKMSAYDPKRAARESKRAIMHARALATTNTNTNTTTQADRNN